MVIALFLAITTSNPTGHNNRWYYGGMDLFIRLLEGGAIILALWLFLDATRRAFAIIRVWWQEPNALPRASSAHLRLGLAPALLAFLIFTGATDWPLRLRFALSRPALRAAADAQLAVGHGTYEPQWIGLYYVSAVLLSNSGGVFLDTCSVDHMNRPPVSRVGFYLDGPPRRNRQVPYRFVNLGSGWSAAIWDG